MILPAAFVLGFLFGWMRAARRGGNRMDRAQYGFGHGMVLMLVTLVATIVIESFLTG
ncbi:hypothetical protein [Paroceanicella profunda]|uniref:hypothetical protein n=1 Tax=Paroceanicella profunda TaxID=2579971 RepID=UPI00147906DB|nr:hypothetical protein [Paroceanicella profunda]